MINQHAERLKDIAVMLDLIGQEVGCRLPQRRFLDADDRLAVEDRLDEIRRPVPVRKLLDVQHHIKE